MKVYESLKQKYKESIDKGIELELVELSQQDIDLLEIELKDLIDIYAKMQIYQIKVLNYVLKWINLPNIKRKNK